MFSVYAVTYEGDCIQNGSRIYKLRHCPSSRRLGFLKYIQKTLAYDVRITRCDMV